MPKRTKSGSGGGPDPAGAIREAAHIRELYGDWFLDYASYVILERAVPALQDGLKPVQRRILHALNLMDDGRFNKAANVIGSTMQFHPHGDAAIGEALVHLGQKGLLIETQGNWGDVVTGDRAAAPRYIEARLSPFAKEVVFNPQTTTWQLSYDGRKKEPVHLPVKFPLLLAQGAEGIAVGLATKIMPHNFCELLDASIAHLRGEPFELLPDFPTGGVADVRGYSDGMRGGKVRVRARIEISDRKTLVVREIPYGTTTASLMESIVKANDNGKIRIKRVVDNTSKAVEIRIELLPGVSPDVTLDALYAFTDCEVSISPNTCVILDDKPAFLGTREILEISTRGTVELLRRELEIRHHELSEKWHFASLERIFIEKRIYRRIEECESWEEVLATIAKGLKPYTKRFKRTITEEDIARLTEIRIKRISKYNVFRANEAIRDLEKQIAEVEANLADLVSYAIRYFESLRERYGEGRGRRTELRSFETVAVAQVAHANQKLYVNRAEGFVGYGIRKEEYVSDCSDLDDVIVFLRDGSYQVTRVAEKTFVGKDILHVSVWKKNDTRMVYNAIYRDGASGVSYAKRFTVTGATRDRPYNLTLGAKGSEVLYLTANPNGEAEVVTVHLAPRSRARKKVFPFDFSQLAVKGRSSKGNIVSKHRVQRVVQARAGTSTLGGMRVWYDPTVGRLNNDSRGRLLGRFEGDDRILAVSADGTVKLTPVDLAQHYDPEALRLIEKHAPGSVLTAVYLHGEKKHHHVKRLETDALPQGRPVKIIPEARGSVLLVATTDPEPAVRIHCVKGRARQRHSESLELNGVVGVKGWKAAGNRLSNLEVERVEPIEPDSVEAPPEDGNGEEPGGQEDLFD